MKILAVVTNLYTNTFDTLYYEAKKNTNIDFKFVLVPYKHGLTDFSVNMETLRKYMDKIWKHLDKKLRKLGIIQ